MRIHGRKQRLAAKHKQNRKLRSWKLLLPTWSFLLVPGPLPASQPEPPCLKIMAQEQVLEFSSIFCVQLTKFTWVSHLGGGGNLNIRMLVEELKLLCKLLFLFSSLFPSISPCTPSLFHALHLFTFYAPLYLQFAHGFGWSQSWSMTSFQQFLCCFDFRFEDRDVVGSIHSFVSSRGS